MTNTSWCGAKAIQFNYGIQRWNMFPRQSGRVSFFWKGVLSCLPALRGCVLHGVNSGTETIFWKDRWVGGRAPMYMWPEEFSRTQAPNGMISELSSLLDLAPYSTNPDKVRGIANGGKF